VDESREQTQAIHAVQRERRTLAGLHAKAEREAIVKTHQDAQRLLEPLAVMNPYANRLTFLDDRTRTRRDHEKYLTLIDVIALLHQHQREIKSTAHGGSATCYVEVTLDDIAWANRLAHEVLGRTLDELPPQTRSLLSLLVQMVERECTAQGTRRADTRFSRRRVREHTRWGDTQLKIHLARLVELEYLLVHRGGRGQSFEYELLYDGVSDEARHLSGLIDVQVLRTVPATTMSCDYDAERSGVNTDRSGVGRPPVGVQSGDGRAAQLPLNADKTSLNDESSAPEPKTHGTGNGTKPPAYPQSPLVAHA